MSQKKVFLLIEHGGDRKKFTFETLMQKRINVFLACTRPPKWVLKYVSPKNIILTDTYNSVTLLSDVVAYFEHNAIRLNAVGTFHEHNVTQTADLAAALNLVGNNPAAARRSSHNKLLMRKFCREANIPTPKFRPIDDLNEITLRNTVIEIGFPCVIKPIFGAESFGTFKIDKSSSYKNILKEIKNSTTSDKKEVFKNFTGRFVVEEYLPGAVVSVDGLVQDNKIHIAGMVGFAMGPEPRFTQEANFIPPNLNVSMRSKCMAVAKRIIKVLGFNNCGFHCELRITDRGPILIEIASRLPGGPLQLGYKKAYGFDLTSLLIDIWLGKRVNLKKKINKYVLQKAVFSRQSGEVKKFSGLKKIKEIGSLWDFKKIVKIGESVDAHDGLQKPLYYFALTESTRQKLIASANQIEKSINLEFA